MKKFVVLLLLVILAASLAACGGTATQKQTGEAGSSAEKKDLTLGATSGPYADMLNKAIKPELEKKGYKVRVVEFSDYVQPNLALDNGDLDANLFQHKVYMQKFAADKGLQLSAVIAVPTAPMGLYSNKYKSLDDLPNGAQVTLANDPSNLARTLILLEKAGLIKIDPNVDPTKASEKDVKENPKNLKLVPIEAGQLPRSLDSADLAAVPGNFALASHMDLLSALKLEEMEEKYMNQVVVNTKDLNAQFTKDIKAAVESDFFEKVIDEQFKGFQKPDWMKNRSK